MLIQKRTSEMDVINWIILFCDLLLINFEKNWVTFSTLNDAIVVKVATTRTNRIKIHRFSENPRKIAFFWSAGVSTIHKTVKMPSNEKKSSKYLINLLCREPFMFDKSIPINSSTCSVDYNSIWSWSWFSVVNKWIDNYNQSRNGKAWNGKACNR